MNKLYDVINSKTQGDSERKHERVAPDVFAQQMKEKRETLNEKVSDMLEEVSNDPQQYMNFLDTVAKFEQYSITNSLLIMAQKPDATIIKDNSKWRENKCYVKKGEKAFQILEPGEAYQRSDGTSGINYNIKSMFDISQLSTPPIMHQKEALNTEEVLSALTYKTPVKIDVVAQNENGENAYFSEHENTIHLSSNLNEADMLNGLTREMCYAEMREMYGTLDRDGFAFSAESATYLLCKKYDIPMQDTTFANEVSEYFAGEEQKDIKEFLSETKSVFDNVSKRMENGLYAQHQSKTQERNDVAR